MTPDQPWMWHWGGMWIFPMIMFVVIICLFVMFGRGGCGISWKGSGGHHREGGESESSLEILKKRYAKGEITKGEFERMKKDIE